MGSPEVLQAYRKKEVLSWPKMTMPFPRVPERRPSFSPDLLNTAGHELNHALVAIAFGEKVISVSIRREGYSLGRTMFAGSVSSDAMKVIAAAGSVATHDGCSHGYGSDMYHVDLLSRLHGGISRESAITQAESAISRYSVEIRKRAAEKIAYHGTLFGDIPGSMIPKILFNSQMELNLEKGIIDNPVVPEQNSDFNETEPKPENYTVIDHLKDGSYRISYVIGERKREELICGACNGVNDHYKDCPKSNGTKHEPDILNNRAELPKEGIIFSNN